MVSWATNFESLGRVHKRHAPGAKSVHGACAKRPMQQKVEPS